MDIIELSKSITTHSSCYGKNTQAFNYIITEKNKLFKIHLYLLDKHRFISISDIYIWIKTKGWVEIISTQNLDSNLVVTNDPIVAIQSIFYNYLQSIIPEL